jgi:DNA polymerase-3 subunit epsilon
MKVAFISLVASGNNLSRSKMINLSILVREDGHIISEFDDYIKPVPHLSKAEKDILPFDYSFLRNASPLCDLTFPIIDLLENAQTVFLDKFSERVFKKSFKEIGYPIGGATFILEKTFKNLFKLKKDFNLNMALSQLKIDQAITSNLGRCKAMEKIFSKLEDNISEPIPISKTHLDSNVDFSNLPHNPGVYFFRNKEGNTIYVGKAKNISKRVRSHFNSTLAFERKLCSQTSMIDFEETGNETIALLLESYYINHLKPKQNSQQKEIINPYIITSKKDSKGILRIQVLQKLYLDSENEFYYNRDSVLSKVSEIQRKFNLCKRYTGLERTSTKCSDPVFCKGICENKEDKEIYNARVQTALDFIFAQRPSYIIKLKGRSAFEEALILVKNGLYQGFGYIDSGTCINSLEDIEGFVKHFPHTYFTSRILDQFFKNYKNSSQEVFKLAI